MVVNFGSDRSVENVQRGNFFSRSQTLKQLRVVLVSLLNELRVLLVSCSKNLTYAWCDRICVLFSCVKVSKLSLDLAHQSFEHRVK